MLTQVEIMEIVAENFYKDFSPFTQSYQDSNTNCLREVGSLCNRITDKDPVFQWQEQFMGSPVPAGQLLLAQCIPTRNDVAHLHFCFNN